jgi:hypothetical protein
VNRKTSASTAVELDAARAAAARAAVARAAASRVVVPKDALAYLLRILGSPRAVASTTGLHVKTVRNLTRPDVATCNRATADVLTYAAARFAEQHVPVQSRPARVPAPRADVDEVIEAGERLPRPLLVAIETEHMLMLGESPEVTAVRLGMSVESLMRNLHRAQRADLAQRVSRIRAEGRAVAAS